MKYVNKQKGAAVVPIIIVIIILAIIVAVLVGQSGESPEVVNAPAETVAEPTGSRGEAVPGETMPESDEEEKMMDDAPTGAQASGSYEAYAPEKLARANNGDVVLFFHASWCPSCRSQEKAILDNAAGIPEGLSILKVDYDSNVDLRQKYDVRLQHTFVQVDAEGNQIAQWSGGTDLAAVLKNVQ